MIAGIILCGGASQRMGRPKANLEFLGEPLLQRMIRIVQTVCQPIVVAAGPNQTLMDLPPNVVVTRDETEFQGPVLGLGSAFGMLSVEVAHAFVVGCDTPLLQPETIRQFISLARPGIGVVARVDGFLQTLPALYPLTQNDHANSLKELLAQISFTELPESEVRKVDPDLWSFRPMNTPAELAAALQHASS